MAKKVTLDWTDPSPTTYVNQLEIWRKLDGGTYAHIGGVQLGDETYDDLINVISGEKYYYEVRAYNIDNNYSVVENNITISDFILDAYTNAVAAYSLRKLKSSVNYAIEVRRDVGTPTTTGVQVYANGDSIDLNSTVAAGGTLGDWVGANSAYVKTWYDQSGSGNDAVQLTNADQLPIVKTGTLVVNASNGLAALESTDSNFLTNNMTFTNEMSSFVVHNRTGGSLNGALYGNLDVNPDFIHWYSNTLIGSFRVNDGSDVTLLSGTLTNDLRLFTATAKTGLIQFFGDGSLYDSDNTFGTWSPPNDLFYITHFQSAASSGFVGNVQEYIFFSSDKSSDRTAIEADINNHYSIY